MARGNKFKPKPVAVMAVAVGEAVVSVAVQPAPQPSTTAPTAPPARDRAHAASTPAAATETAAPVPAAAAAAAAAAAGTKRKAEPAAAAPAPAQHPHPPARKRLAVPTLVALPTPSSPTSPAAALGAANWLALKAAASIGKKHGGKNMKKHGSAPQTTTAAATAPPPPPPSLLPAAIGSTAGATRILAMDCEMVGVGPGGVRSALARVCLVNEAGCVLLDTHVSPRERVTDHRTHVSGVAPSDLRGAPDLDTVRERVERIIAGRTLVGHAIAHDLAALMISHPRAEVRDTARYPPFMRATAPGRKPKPRRLRDLAAEVLGLTIQGGAHSPLDDARAALYLYQHARKEWEAAAKKPGGVGKNSAAPVRTGGRVAAKAAAENASAKLGALAAVDEMADL